MCKFYTFFASYSSIQFFSVSSLVCSVFLCFTVSIAQDKRWYWEKYFSYFSAKTYVVGECLCEALLMSTHNLCFCGEIRKIWTIFYWKNIVLSGAMVSPVCFLLLFVKLMYIYCIFSIFFLLLDWCLWDSVFVLSIGIDRPEQTV